VNKRGSYYRYLNRFGWLCVAPAMVFYCLFMLYPILSSLYYVTRKWKGMSNTFVGLGNFARMPTTRSSSSALGHNFLFMFVQIPLMIFLALILAVILNQGIKRMQGHLQGHFLPALRHLPRRLLGAVQDTPPEQRTPQQPPAERPSHSQSRSAGSTIPSGPRSPSSSP
jgi:ABC-type uncharacterized transport system permease subunit